MATRVFVRNLLVSTLTLATVPLASDAYGKAIENPDDSRVIGGTTVESCAYPATVALHTRGGEHSCTASLVAPNVITYAAHCGNQYSNIYVGDHSSSPKRTIPIQKCETNPKFNNNFGSGVDFAYCILSEEVTDIPITPILMGCETEIVKAGGTALIVGYGNTVGNFGGGSGPKRQVEVPIVNVKANGEVEVGQSGKGACHGDSGGPLFIQLPEELDPERSWRVFGVTSYGPTPCPGQSHYGLLHDTDAVVWIEQQTGIDITPCHDADGTWAPTADCGNFPIDPGESGRDWNNMCATDERTKMSSTCGPAFSTDDEAPSVDITSPKDGKEFGPDDSIDVTVDASDNEGVAEVELFLDGVSQGVDDASPYEFTLDPIDLGSYELTAIARDEAGNEGESDAVSFDVAEPDDDEGDSDSDTDSSDSDSSDTDSSDSDNDSDSDSTDSNSDDTDTETDTDSDGDSDSDGSDSDSTDSNSDSDSNGDDEGDDNSTDDDDADDEETDEDDDDKSKDPGSDKKDGGCSTTSTRGNVWLWALSLMFVGGITRRRRNASTSNT